jgi:hypothetical protein
MTIDSSPLASKVVAAPFMLERPIARLGRALWLYLWLVVHANRTGLACRTLSSLAQALDIADSECHLWLERLVDAQLVEVQNPSPYLVIKLRFWSSSDAESAESTRELPRAPARAHVGSSKLLHAAAAENKNKQQQAGSREDGGAGEGEGLLAEARTILGAEPDDTELADVLTRHPVEFVRKALRRVENTPASQIRKSKYALFRYLLVRLSREIHDRDSKN